MSAQGILMEPRSEAETAVPSPTARLISVVVPVVERTDDLLSVYQAFARELDARPEDYEFLFIFDGRFVPPAELVAVAQKNESVRLLRFARPFGETAALRLGIEKSRGDVVLTLPAYFQVQPEGIRRLLDAVEGGADMVVASRSPRLDSWLNRLQSRAFQSIVGGVSEQRFHDMACGVRAMRRTSPRPFRCMETCTGSYRPSPCAKGSGSRRCRCPQHPGDARTRLYGPGVYLRRLLDIGAFFFLAKFTEKPLRFFGLVGSVFLGVGTVLSAVLLIQRVEGQGIANRPALLLAVLFLALGVQLMGLGLVGEIIVHLRAPHRRAYRVRERA